ncbi:hypothetical protein ABIC45_004229 [Mucilaginibacter rubeus]|uniref:hypothetical protein n=2 Tax=Mucilaginibacter TaxID=423349 RepID=UPI003393A095
MINIDLYSDYVGELEIIFLEKSTENEIVFKVDLWYADFASLMGYIPIQPNMPQDSLTYNWQKVVGFYDVEEWEYKRVQEFHDQLLAIVDMPSAAGLDNVRNALLQICDSALQNGNRLFIQYT